MSPIQSNKYHNGAYEVLGYVTRDDINYFITRNCAKCAPENKGNKKSNDKDNVKIAAATNALTALGYIPGIALLPAVVNIFRGSNKKRIKFDPKTDNAYKCMAITKGIFQILGLGLVFLPSDLWVTGKRRSNPPILK